MMRSNVRLWSGLRVNSLDCVSSSLCKHNPLQRTRVIVNEAWPERVLLKLSTWLRHENHETLFGGKFKVLQSGRSIFGSVLIWLIMHSQSFFWLIPASFLMLFEF
jgi:hypothetical protein